jgi:predicted amidohydrolase YtcJ
MTADLLTVGARVRTLDPGCPLATAIAVRRGRILAVGDDAHVRARAGADAETIDGAGMVVVPGLVDAHQHPIPGAEVTRGADLSAARTLADVRDALAAEHARCGPRAWVRAHSLAYAALEGADPRADLIEDAVGGAPALVTFFDLHTAIATDAALAAGGVAGPRTFEDASEVVCRDGEPTGELREASAIALVERAAPALADDERLALVRDALARMNAVGLTGVHAMDGAPEQLAVYRALEDAGWLTVRAVVPFVVDPDLPTDAYRDLAAASDERGRLWRAGAAKFSIDGVVETGTAWLDEPDAHGRGGEPFWPDPRAYADAVRYFDGAGFQCATHAIGDRAVRAALDAYRDAAAANGDGPRTAPHRVEHIETLKDADLPRFAAEGVTASQQAIHTQWIAADGSDPWSGALGRERAGRGFRLGDLRRSGAVLALGSDWPVAGFDPREGMARARLRRAPRRRDEPVWLPEQRLDALAALEGYTCEAARAIGASHELGRIAPGFRPDLTAFAGDPVECDADDLPDLPVRLTIVAGRVVHRAE